MPRGRLGFRRFSSIPPLVNDDPIIFHFTRDEALDSILQEGFEEGYKQIHALLDDDFERGGLESIATLDKSIDTFKPRRLSFIPDRFGSNFFFPDRKRPEEILGKRIESIERSDGEVDEKINVVMVDSGKIPCRGARVEYSATKSINNSFFNNETTLAVPKNPVITSENINQLEVDKSVLSDQYKSEVRQYWRDAEVYRGQRETGYEVWFNCSIPPDAIVGIVDPRDGEML